MELDTLYRKLKSIAVFALASALFFACKKAEDRTCFKSVGKDSEKTIELPEFDKLLLREHIEFVLIQDSTNKLVIKGGENLLNLIEWNIDENKVLEIRNENKCNFLRKLSRKVKVEIHFTNMYNLHFEGTEPLTNTDTLNIPYFTMLIRDGAGSVKLNLHAVNISADISHGWGDYTLTGTAEFAKIAARSNGFCDVRDLKIRDSVFVSSETSGTMKLNANLIPLRGEIKGNGDIWYYGNPTMVKISEMSIGKLVSKN